MTDHCDYCDQPQDLTPIAHRIADTAKVLGVAASVLKYWRQQGVGPEYVQVSTKVLLRPRESLLRFLAEHTMISGKHKASSPDHS